MIVLLPLEPLEERYTEQWSCWFPEQFHIFGVNYKTIVGKSLTSKIETGSVLDCHGTNFWKMTQLAKVIECLHNKQITNKDSLLFADLWFPGIEALQYIKCIKGSGPKITGIFHAGTYDSNDFTYRTNMRPWGHMLEESWLQFIDVIFVATQYHKELILKNHNVNDDRIKVTGIPFYPDEVVVPRREIKKIKQRIIFPHREDIEKQPQEFSDLMGMLQPEFPGMTYMMTGKHRNLGKNWFYDELAKAEIAVSMAQQETFGYSMIEATALGCTPLVPDRLSYCELYRPEFKYRSFCELIDKLRKLLKDGVRSYEVSRMLQIKQHQDVYLKAIEKILSYLR